jgi:hypothetical protein
MDYAIGRQAGGGSDGMRLGRKKRALMDDQVPQLGVRLRCFEDGSGTVARLGNQAEVVGWWRWMA